jgi:hypothetical protein
VNRTYLSTRLLIKIGLETHLRRLPTSKAGTYLEALPAKAQTIGILAHVKSHSGSNTFHSPLQS